MEYEMNDFEAELASDFARDEKMLRELEEEGKLEVPENCELTWDCPCERCNGGSEEPKTEAEWVKKYVLEDEELMAVLKEDGVVVEEPFLNREGFRPLGPFGF